MNNRIYYTFEQFIRYVKENYRKKNINISIDDVVELRNYKPSLFLRRVEPCTTRDADILYYDGSSVIPLKYVEPYTVTSPIILKLLGTVNVRTNRPVTLLDHYLDSKKISKTSVRYIPRFEESGGYIIIKLENVLR
ncbi:MAG: hypothetical protein DRJ35_06940 [Thermoprotei archaeon]|nr:MAG: hypothetical protein DRJ35_06940 [Thermoprotei archaeon]